MKRVHVLKLVGKLGRIKVKIWKELEISNQEREKENYNYLSILEVGIIQQRE